MHQHKRAIGLSEAYRSLAIAGDLPPTELRKAKVAAQKAIDIDESLAEAHTALGAAMFGENGIGVVPKMK